MIEVKIAEAYRHEFTFLSVISVSPGSKSGMSFYLNQVNAVNTILNLPGDTSTPVRGTCGYCTPSMMAWTRILVGESRALAQACGAAWVSASFVASPPGWPWA